MKSNGDRGLTAMFCDDIRHEVGNKMSFMGIYQGDLVIQGTAPMSGVAAALPKLCIFATAWTPKDRPFKELTLRVVQDDTNELARLPFPLQDNDTQADDPTTTRKTANAVMAFSPFLVEKQTTLRVLAVTEEGEMVGPRLLIKVVPPVAAPVSKAEAAKPAKKRAAPTTKARAPKKR